MSEPRNEIRGIITVNGVTRHVDIWRARDLVVPWANQTAEDVKELEAKNPDCSIYFSFPNINPGRE